MNASYFYSYRYKGMFYMIIVLYCLTFIMYLLSEICFTIENIIP